MITIYKREDLQKILDEEHELHNSFDLLADKLRVIYLNLGWSHMTCEYFKANELVKDLTEDVIKLFLKRDGDDFTVASAGLSVKGWFDVDGFLNLDYHFVLI